MSSYCNSALGRDANVPDQKRAVASVLYSPFAPVFCIWLLGVALVTNLPLDLLAAGWGRRATGI